MWYTSPSIVPNPVDLETHTKNMVMMLYLSKIQSDIIWLTSWPAFQGCLPSMERSWVGLHILEISFLFLPKAFHGGLGHCIHSISDGGGLVSKLCPTLATPCAVASQSPLSMGFSRQEYWSGLPLPSPADLPNPGIKPGSPTLQADSLPTKL